MAILRVLFRRATPSRVRLMALMNISAFCFVAGMTLMTSALAYFLLVPHLFKENDPVMQAHRSVIVYMFVNVVGNFILCIFTDTSVAKCSVGTNSVDRRLTTAVNRVSTKLRGNDRRSKSRSKRKPKGQESTQRSDESTVTKSSQESVSGTSDPRINAPVCGRSMNPSLTAASADSDSQKICSSKESNQTDSPATTSACEGKTLAEKGVEATTRTTHLLLHDQISNDGSLGSEQSMGSGRTAARCDLRTDSDSKTAASDTHGSNRGPTGFWSYVSKIFSYSPSKSAPTGQRKRKQSLPSEKNAVGSVSDETKKPFTSDTMPCRQTASVAELETNKSDLENGDEAELLTRKKNVNVPLEENPADHTLPNSVDITGTASTFISSNDDEATDSSHSQTSSDTSEEPLRSHHCVLCEKRILRRDHHCFFMTVCVGYHNHKHFIFFCLFMLAGTFYAVVLIARFLNVVYGVRFYGPQTFFFLLVKMVSDVLQKRVFPQPLFAFLLFEMYACLLVGLAAGGFLYWHLAIAVTGQTTHEATRDDRRYSQGRLANIRDLFGLYWPLLFVLPLPLPQARDGSHYTANPGNQGRDKAKGSKVKDKNVKDKKSSRADKDGDGSFKGSAGRKTPSAKSGQLRSGTGQGQSGSKGKESGNIRKRKT